MEHTPVKVSNPPTQQLLKLKPFASSGRFMLFAVALDGSPGSVKPRSTLPDFLRHFMF